LTEQILSGPFPQLEAGDYVLRDLQESDAEALYRQFADPEVTRWYDLETFTDPEEARQLLQVYRHRRDAGIGLRWGICRRDAPDELMGTCGYNLWLRRSARAILGFDLARPHWRQGVMRTCLGRILDFGFDEMLLNRVEALAFTGNDASRGLLENLGFTAEGVLRQYEALHGTPADMVMYSLLQEDRR
jgi:ribosomal-protein-alanine N-acetyltransferase